MLRNKMNIVKKGAKSVYTKNGSFCALHYKSDIQPFHTQYDSFTQLNSFEHKQCKSHIKQSISHIHSTQKQFFSNNLSINHFKNTHTSNKQFNYIIHKNFSTNSQQQQLLDILQSRISQVAQSKIEILKNLKQNNSSTQISPSTVSSILGGMRGLKSLICETSEVDGMKGLKYRGLTIEECEEKLPKAKNGENPLIESLFWLLLTGDIPNEEEVMLLNNVLCDMASVPTHIFDILNLLPNYTHPMTQLIIAISALQTTSLFAKQYINGLHKSQYWKYILIDALNLVAKVPVIAAYIYKKDFKNDKSIPSIDKTKDLAANFSQMMGYTSEEHFEFMRLYYFLHADHEGGNVSAHAATLIGSALSDPFLSFTASMTGLAGPLHGLANQECLKWLLQLKKKLNGQPPTKQIIKQLSEDTLKAGQVIPGYGHAVLRVTDPRFQAQNRFAKKHLPDSELLQLLNICVEVIPEVLLASGKVKNPYPNVDCHSGVLLHHFGILEENFYTVLFGVARCVGVSSQLVWNRILGLPIERPLSISLSELQKEANK